MVGGGWRSITPNVARTCSVLDSAWCLGGQGGGTAAEDVYVPDSGTSYLLFVACRLAHTRCELNTVVHAHRPECVKDHLGNTNSRTLLKLLFATITVVAFALSEESGRARRYVAPIDAHLEKKSAAKHTKKTIISYLDEGNCARADTRVELVEPAKDVHVAPRRRAVESIPAAPLSPVLVEPSADLLHRRRRRWRRCKDQKNGNHVCRYELRTARDAKTTQNTRVVV